MFLYNSIKSKELDQLTIKNGISGFLLMMRASKKLWTIAFSFFLLILEKTGGRLFLLSGTGVFSAAFFFHIAAEKTVFFHRTAPFSEGGCPLRGCPPAPHKGILCVGVMALVPPPLQVILGTWMGSGSGFQGKKSTALGI